MAETDSSSAFNRISFASVAGTSSQLFTLSYSQGRKRTRREAFGKSPHVIGEGSGEEDDLEGLVAEVHAEAFDCKDQSCLCKVLLIGLHFLTISD